MKKIVYIISITALVLNSCQISESNKNTKTSTEQIVIGESTTIFSEILGENRNVLLSLPTNYNRNIHSYPVIIVLDAEYLFELTNAIVKIKVSRNEMPESIIVGIPNSPGRRYDMAMQLSYSDGKTFFGNANGEKIKDYLTFFDEELFPFLRKNYRVNNHKSIIGMSPTFGPVLEAFWTKPDMFDGYIVLAAELALKTTSGQTIQERILKAIQDIKRPKSAIYIGKASDDLKRRPNGEALAYIELNQKLENTANPNINYRVEILENENHYGMSISGIEHGLKTIYPFTTWDIPYREFWNSENPANEIEKFYNNLSDQYGFEILPLEDSFYAAQSLLGTARRLKREGRTRELKDLIQLILKYYPNSSELNNFFEKN